MSCSRCQCYVCRYIRGSHDERIRIKLDLEAEMKFVTDRIVKDEMTGFDEVITEVVETWRNE